MSDTQRHTKPNVPNLRFPGFEGEWSISTIRDEFELYSGNTPSRLDKNNYIGEINWITSGELKDHYIADTKEKISEKSAIDNNLRLLPEGTFVIAIYGLEAEGVRATGSITTKKATISQACMAFTPKGKISNEFLYSWYKKHGNLIGIKYAQGTKQQNLSYDIIERLSIRYPSSQEQNKLNSFISLLDARIAIQNKVIDRYQSLIRAIIQQSQRNSSSRVYLREIMTERKELNTCGYDICSVSVSKGVINQVEYLGRSFAAKETSHYHVVKEGDIVYTKSPTGAFPFGIIKQSNIKKTVAVSPLYGVYEPKSLEIGTYLHYLFCSPQNVQNYLRKLIQKGAKNTINITNQHFLDNQVCLPGPKDLSRIVFTINSLAKRIEIEEFYLCQILIQKEYLLQQLFI